MERFHETASQLLQNLSLWVLLYGNKANDFSARAVLNEGDIEHDHSTPVSGRQFRILNPQEYQNRLGEIFQESVIRISQVGFSTFTGQRYTYENPQGPRTHLQAHQLLNFIKQADQKINGPTKPPPSKSQLAHAQQVARLVHSRRSRTVRDYQSKPHNLSPFTVTQIVPPGLQSDQTGSLSDLQRRAHANAAGPSCVIDRDRYLFFPGDVIIRKPAGADLFEVWRCSRLFDRCRLGSRCKVWARKL